MSLCEFGPGHAFLSLRRGCETVLFEDILDGVAAYGKAVLFQGVPKPCITPTLVLASPLDDEVFDLSPGVGPSWASFFGIVPFFPNLFPVPAKESVGGNQGGYFSQDFSPKSL